MTCSLWNWLFFTLIQKDKVKWMFFALSEDYSRAANRGSNKLNRFLNQNITSQLLMKRRSIFLELPTFITMEAFLRLTIVQPNFCRIVFFAWPPKMCDFLSWVWNKLEDIKFVSSSLRALLVSGYKIQRNSWGNKFVVWRAFLKVWLP